MGSLRLLSSASSALCLGKWDGRKLSTMSMHFSLPLVKGVSHRDVAVIVFSKAPASENICKVLVTSYEVERSEGLLGEESLPSSQAHSKESRGDGESTVAATACTESTSGAEAETTVTATVPQEAPVLNA